MLSEANLKEVLPQLPCCLNSFCPTLPRRERLFELLDSLVKLACAHPHTFELVYVHLDAWPCKTRDVASRVAPHPDSSRATPNF